MFVDEIHAVATHEEKVERIFESSRCIVAALGRNFGRSKRRLEFRVEFTLPTARGAVGTNDDIVGGNPFALCRLEFVKPTVIVGERVERVKSL